MIEISTYEQLLDYAFDLLDKSKTIEKAEIKDGLDFTIKIKGKTWDGFIDWRLAKFILDIQQAVNKAFKESDIDLSKAEQELLAIKFKISEGCSLLEIKPGPAIKALLKNMSGLQKTSLGIIALLAALGYFTQGQFLDYKAKVEAKAQDETTKKELIQLSKDILSKLPTYEKAMRGLASRLHEGDIVEISSRQVQLNKKQLTSEYPRKKKNKQKTVYLDGTYLVHSIKFTNDAVRITIESGSDRLECGVALNDNDLAKLYAKAKEQHDSREGFSMALKITAKYAEGSKPKEPVIFGLGDSREGAINLSTLLGNN